MKLQQLQTQLLNLAKQNRLGHFYILQGRGPSEALQCAWVKEFVRRHWSLNPEITLPADIMNDANLLWLLPWDEEENCRAKEYMVANLAPLSTFLSYRGLRGRRRFVILEDIHKMKSQVANRLLKILEEPIGEVTFFALNPQGTKLLDTIESRALFLPLCEPSPQFTSTQRDEREQLLASYARLNLGEFLEEMKKTNGFELLLEEILSYEQVTDGPASVKQDLLELYSRYQYMKSFNLSAIPQLQGVHLYLTHRFRTSR